MAFEWMQPGRGVFGYEAPQAPSQGLLGFEAPQEQTYGLLGPPPPQMAIGPATLPISELSNSVAPIQGQAQAASQQIQPHEPWGASPLTFGLLGAAAQLLQAGGRSTRPINLGEAVGRGLLGGVQGYHGGQDMLERSEERGLRRQGLLDRAAKATTDARRQASAEAQISSWIARQPEQQRDALWASYYSNPTEFGSQLSKNILAEHDESRYFKTVGNDVVDVRTGQRTYRAPFAPSQPDNALVEIYDSNSPTGTSFVPRAQAVGRPGPPPSGTSISYDEQGRPVITMGRQQPKPTEGPGTLPPDMAGRAAALEGTSENLGAIEGYFFPGGKFNTAAAAATKLGSAGQMLDPASGAAQAHMAGAIDTMIRLRTGAAATKAEVENYMGMYAPSPMDTEATARAKLDMLKQDIGKARAEVERSRKGGGTAKDSPAKSSAPAPAKPATPPAAGSVEGGYRFKGGDPSKPENWELAF